MDRETGSLSHLNHTAAEIWSDAIANIPHQSIAEHLTARYGVSREQALRDVTAALAPLPPVHLPRLETQLLYTPSEGGYLLSFNGTNVLAYDAEAKEVRLLEGGVSGEYGIYLRAVAPKITATSGVCVLHAAAIAGPEREVLAFVGLSGAGKTTTAKTFASTGFAMVCEDKLIWRTGPSDGEVVLNGEATINRWIEATVSQWAKERSRPCKTTSLKIEPTDATLPITRIFLLQCGRTARASIELAKLSPSLAARELFQHGFYGSSLDEDWEAQLKAVSQLARSARVYQATMPEGLPALSKAVRHYIETTAS
jgi:hypothetical protein